MRKKAKWSDRANGRSADDHLLRDEAIVAEEALPKTNVSRLGRLREAIKRRLRRFGSWYMRTPGSHLLACFAMPAVMMILIYSLMGTFPTGPSSVLVLDLNGQYVYFFEALRDWVWGDGSLLYSFSRSLGGEFLGIYAYYLASPLSYIVAIFPKVMITEALYLMFVIKCGLSGLTFGYYMYRTKRASRSTTVIFSILYALSAYAVVMQHNTMWIDNLYLLPLIALGIDLMISEGRYKLFTFSLILAVMSNYYIGYMTCIFVFLYFFYSFFSRSREARNPRGLRLHFWRSLARIGFFSAIALGVACLIVIPAYYSLTFGKNEFSDPNFEFIARYDLLDLLSKFLFASYDTVRPEGLPFVYCGTLTIFSIPLYFGCRKIDGREKICGALLAIVFLASFNINTLDMVWHGFQMPNWLNYRYSFMFCFIILVMAARGFDHLKLHTSRSVILIGSVLAFFLLLFQKFDLIEFNSKLEWLDSTLSLLLNAIIILAWVCMLTWVLRRRERPHNHLAALVAILVCIEAVLGGVVNLAQLSCDVTISWRRTYRDFMKRWQDPIDEVLESDTSPFYRLEKTVYRKVNDPYALGYRGLSGSTSTLNADTIAYLSYMGVSARSHWTKYVDACPPIDSLFSIKYVFTEADDKVSALYPQYYTNGDVTAYLNPYSLPLAYGVDAGIRDITFNPPAEDEIDEDGNVILAPIDPREYIDTTSVPIRINALLGRMLGGDQPIEVFEPISHRIANFYNPSGINNTSVGMVTGHKYYSRKDETQEAYINYDIDSMPRSAELYCYIPTLYLREVKILVNGEEIGPYMSNDTHGVISLGYFNKGDDVTFTVSVGKEGTYLGSEDYYFFAFNEDLFVETMAELSDSGYELTECTEDSFEGRINVLEGEETIITSIPYDRGWRVTCDGEEIETFEVLDALLAFELPVGSHELTLVYMPREYKAAALISGASSALLAAILVGERLTVVHRRKRESSEDSAN